MKIKTSIIYFLLFSLMITIGCKKGENDPFLSFNSRSERIVGEWTLTKYDKNVLYLDSSDNYWDKELLSYVFDGEKLNFTFTEEDESDKFDTTMTHDYFLNLTINEDGTFVMKSQLDSSANEIEGNWWWVDMPKDKSGINFDPPIFNNFDYLYSSYFYYFDYYEFFFFTNNNNFSIDRLSSSDFIINQSLTIKGIEDDFLGRIDNNSNYTFEKTK